MNRFLSVAAAGLLTLGVVVYGTQARAQSEPAPGGQTQDQGQGGHMGGHMGHGPMTPERQLERLSENLNLTDDQKQQIKPILEDRQKQAEQLHSDTSMSMDDKRAKMRSLSEESNNKIRAILNDDQKQKFDKMQERMREHMMHNQAGAEHPAPPSQ
jgi:Spy/CpxP family protein refolding chaperone